MVVNEGEDCYHHYHTFFFFNSSRSAQPQAAPYLLQSPFIGAHTFNEGDGKGVQLVGLVSLVDNSQGYAEAQILQVANLK